VSKDFTYFPFLRTGLSSAVTTADTAAADSFVRLAVKATVNSVAAQAVDLRLAGPGEVVGLDARAVVRTDPAPGAIGAPPKLFAAIELKPADLPWMFTPVGPAGDRLRPWLCLIVTDYEDSGEPVVDAKRPLPMIHVEHPDEVLPDPQEAWAWAHVGYAGETDGAGLETAIGSSPEVVVARLLCPRRLAPERRYVAALVPLFEGGRLAGLGAQVSDSAKLKDAWSVADGAPGVDLPVYHSWTFMTGVGGDFRSLALRLEGRPLPEGAGSRPMDITRPEGGLPALPATAKTRTLGLEGALQPEGFTPTDWNAGEASTFEQKIGGLVDDANTAQAALGPPLWGRWQAAQPTFPTATPAWLRELNRDPRNRAAAGLGARVVQEQREQLMAQAWEQVGDVERANQLLRQAQLARAQGKSLHRRALPATSDGTFLLLTRPLHDRVLVDKQLTAFGEARASSLPDRLLDGAFRRVARPRGPLGRRLGRDTRDPGELVVNAAAGKIGGAAPALPPHGSAQIVAALERLSPGALLSRVGNSGFVPLSDWQKAPAGHPDTGPDSAVMSQFRQALVDYEAWRAGLARRRSPDPGPPLDPGTLRQRLMDGIDPDATVPRRVAAVVSAPKWAGAGDPLEPILAAPSFPQPMSQPLLAISQELVLPGLQGIPADTVTAAVPNTRFIESYMVGLNHEMARELLFREYPTDQRGTYFRQFWDVRGRVPAPAPGTTDDIGPIHLWPAGNVLGADVTGGGSGLLVVIVRGELLRRYPNAAVYAAPAKWLPAGGATPARRDIDQAAAPKFPVIRGRLEPDLVYFGLALTAADARGSDPPSPTGAAGWFVVFEQHPTEPHYGLADAPTAGAGGTSPSSWDQVTWGDVTPAAPTAPPRQGKFAPATPPAWWTWPGGTLDPAWGASSAAMAAIALERPTRLALHASDLLEP
jgi:hypothetical protein